MRRFLTIYLAFFKQQIKSLIEYKMDFAMGMFALAIQQLASFLVLFAVFSQINAIASYSFNEMLLFFGYSQMLRGVDHVYNDNIWTIGWWRIRDGSFSQFLTRPVGVVSQIVMERVQFDGMGEFLIGLLLYVYAYRMCGLAFTPADWAIFALFFLSGLCIYFAIKLAGAAVAFWTVSSGELMTVSYELSSFTKYPLDMYKSIFIRSLLLYIIPFALVTWVPVVWFIRDHSFVANTLQMPWLDGYGLLFWNILITASLLSIAFIIWRTGLKRYGATGT